MPEDKPEIVSNHRLKHVPEAFIVRLMVGLYSILPLDQASAFGGFLARLIGPKLGASKGAGARLHEFFPHLSDTEVRKLVREMWDNMGRTVAEFPHLREIDTTTNNRRLELVGTEHFEALVKTGKPAIFFSAHFANWELVPLAVDQRGLDVTIAYREANNPFVDQMIRDLRSRAVGARHVPKGAAGARSLLQALKGGRHLGLLVDQKMNDGIAVPFFGRDAMTAPALAQLALRYDAPIIPIHCERLQGARFRIVIEAPLTIVPSGDKAGDIHNIMCKVNDHIESWVRAHPAQWMWVHKRWPKRNGEQT
jgi:Kdo2-lipid IVA lauroyltransferase/acyltransferase